MFYPDRIFLHLLLLQRSSTLLFHTTFSIPLPVFEAAPVQTLTLGGLSIGVEGKDHFDFCAILPHTYMQIGSQTHPRP
jgi:hypothetical protein